jgi:hypothetical protein
MPLNLMTPRFARYFSTAANIPKATHSAKVYRSTDLELVMKFAPEFKTIKLAISPDLTFGDLTSILQNRGANPEVSLTVLPEGKSPDPAMLFADFLNSQQQKELIINVNESLVYSLKSKILPFMDLHNKLLHSKQPNNITLLHSLKEAGISEQSSPLISSFIDSLRSKLPKDAEIDQATFDKFLDQVKQEFNQVSNDVEVDIEMVKRRNKLESVLQSLKLDKEQIYNQIKGWTSKYIMCIILLSIVQFGFFFYTIYMVDWLGWDIMEPITYSLEVLAYLVALRFFYKYRRVRSFEEIERLFARKYFGRYPTEKVKIDSIELKIAEVKKELRLIKIFRELNH